MKKIFLSLMILICNTSSIVFTATVYFYSYCCYVIHFSLSVDRKTGTKDNALMNSTGQVAMKMIIYR